MRTTEGVFQVYAPVLQMIKAGGWEGNTYVEGSLCFPMLLVLVTILDRVLSIPSKMIKRLYAAMHIYPSKMNF